MLAKIGPRVRKRRLGSNRNIQKMRSCKYTGSPATQADICRIAKLLRRMMWRQNQSAAKNAVRPARSTLDHVDSIPEVSRQSTDHSTRLSSRLRSMQARPQLSHVLARTEPTGNRSAVKDGPWEQPSHGPQYLSAEMMGGLPLEKSNDYLSSTVPRIQDNNLEDNTRQSIIMESEKDEDLGSDDTLVKV